MSNQITIENTKFRPFVKLLSFAVVLFFLNSIIVYLFELFPSSWVFYTHIFFACITTLIIYIFNRVAENHIDKAGFVFIGFLFLKILLILIFLQILQKLIAFDKVFIANFSAVYLLYLFFSMYLCLKALNFYQKNKK